MTTPIRVGIVGYGNLGRGAEVALTRCPDMQLVGIFSRRDPSTVKPLNPEVPVHLLSALDGMRDTIDVLLLCGGSKSDLPEQAPKLARHFNTVDSYDTHNRIPGYFEAVNTAAREGDRLAVISVGWDPGLFSLYRLFGEAVLPEGETYTFWGKGLSQGHSDAVRRVPGVKAGVQYTLPSEAAMERARSGSLPTLTTREKHTRECHVVLEVGADPKEVERAIVTMPDYFADYDTTVHFISEEALVRDHSAMPHGGFVIRSGRSGDGNSQVMESSLKLQSNPEFTASVLVAYARAAVRLHRQGERGARSVLDIAPGLLSPKSAAQLRKELL
ncbi:MAG TPA: diaminopimelate dehydrogenase [Myxococcaceae bacterium]|nr:diaminopimelate dehydrogenase [Myxococcaceae bacterium]